MRPMPWMSVVAFAVLAAGLPTIARAGTTGAIRGIVTDEATGNPVAGVTVTVTSPALQVEQTEFTDSRGSYEITELPPGEYAVHFYFANVHVEGSGVTLNADKTIQVNGRLPAEKAKVQTIRVTEHAPNVDIGNTQVETQVTNELVRNVPIRGRTYESVMTLAPGVSADTGNGANFSFSGGTGLENNFLIDGANTTSPSFGVSGTRLSLEFIGETNVITGGYNAEYGRATGGVVNVVTKSGSNQFHGDVWLNAQPFQLDPERVARAGEAIARFSRLQYALDAGFDLGGPIVKDRLWFFVGFNPQIQADAHTRILRLRTADGAAGAMGSYAGSP